MFNLSIGDYCTYYGFAGQHSLVKIIAFGCDYEYNGYVCVKFVSNGNECYQLCKY